MDAEKAATLEVADDVKLVKTVKKLIKEHHQGLADASIALLWALDRSETQWGAMKVASEELWWLSKYDLVLQVNLTLWSGLSDPGCIGLVDHLLSQVERKTGGKTEQSTSRGTRLLYQSDSPSLAIHPQVLARNPQFVRELSQLEDLRRALEEPDQFLLDFAAREAAEAEGDGGEEDLEAATG
jgi:hypothetical protein